MSFTTTAGFGNCAVVSQGAGAADAAPSQSEPGQNKPVRNGAAKGTRPATPADQNPPQPSESGGPKKGDETKNGDKGKSTTEPADTAARRMAPKRNCTSRLIRLPFCECDWLTCFLLGSSRRSLTKLEWKQ